MSVLTGLGIVMSGVVFFLLLFLTVMYCADQNSFLFRISA